jgi:hypothetical protein
MARVISFCPRQVLAGHANLNTDNYSEIFDLSDISTLQAEFRVMGVSATTANLVATIEESSDPTLASSWAVNGPTMTITGTAITNPVRSGYSGLQRFVRAKITMPSGVYGTVCLYGTAREP